MRNQSTGRSLPEAETDWRDRSACTSSDPELFFGPEEEAADERCYREAAARAVCEWCPVAGLCLSWALSTHTSFGIWGGLTGRERVAVLAARSGVAS